MLDVAHLLPLSVKVVIDLLVSDGHHDNQDPEEHHADQELINHPHGNDCSLKIF